MTCRFTPTRLGTMLHPEVRVLCERFTPTHVGTVSRSWRMAPGRGSQAGQAGGGQGKVHLGDLLLCGVVIPDPFDKGKFASEGVCELLVGGPERTVQELGQGNVVSIVDRTKIVSGSKLQCLLV